MLYVNYTKAVGRATCGRLEGEIQIYISQYVIEKDVGLNYHGDIYIMKKMYERGRYLLFELQLVCYK